jgi:hypothetical protein
LVTELLSPSQIGPAMTRMSASRTLAYSDGHPEALPLVEAQVTDVGGRSRDQDGRHGFGHDEVDGGLDQQAPYALPLAGLAHRHVLDLHMPRVIGAGELEVADDLAIRRGHQDAAGVDVRVELGSGILGQLEQRAQAVPWPAVGLDADVVGRTGGHRVSFRVSSDPIPRCGRRPRRLGAACSPGRPR